MNFSVDRGLVSRLAALAADSATRHLEAEQSPAVQKAVQADRELAASITVASEKANSVEELLALERSLQTLDLLKAETIEDKKSIEAAQSKYDQFRIIIEQMRKHPTSYIEMNMGNIKNPRKDPHKIIPDTSLGYLKGNVTRMQNRASFAREGEREIWIARIDVAKKTSALFKSLHKSLADKYIQKKHQAGRET